MRTYNIYQNNNNNNIVGSQKLRLCVLRVITCRLYCSSEPIRLCLQLLQALGGGGQQAGSVSGSRMPLFHLSGSFVPEPQPSTRAGSADPLSGVKLFPCFTCGTLGRRIGTKEGEGVRRSMEKWGTLIIWDADL